MPETPADKIQWHPGFYGAAELEFIDNRGDLEFTPEYSLSKEPIRMDLLIIKKIGSGKIKNEIGRIFKGFNVLEYKSPDDGLTIDDFFKTIGYACLYKGLGQTADAVPAKELTVSLFREAKPKELFKSLEDLGATITEQFPGIYYVNGITMLDTQIVVTSRLRKESHSSLRILSKNAHEDDVRNFLENTEKLDTPGDRDNVEAVLQVSVSANKNIYEKIKEEFKMCEALQNLMKDEINAIVAKAEATAEARGVAKGEARGEARGEANGTLKTKITLIKALMESSNIDVSEAMNRLQITASEREGLKQQIESQTT
jgi:hypothetical protein